MTAGSARAEIGIFGGSGFYEFLEAVEEITVHTPYGAPSAPVAVGTMGGRAVAFLPRHGRRHEHPPHRVNYRANVWAMRELGVTRVLGPCAVGSLRADVAPGHFVVLDQLVDRTWGRPDTFYDGPVVKHMSFADPYCPQLRSLAVDAARAEGVTVHEQGTIVVINGPRFSTRAESAWFRSQGWDTVGMTQYPEAFLARELGLCYAGIALVTDYDTGVEGADHEAVTMEEVLRVMRENVDHVQAVLRALVPAVPAERACGCASAAA